MNALTVINISKAFGHFYAVKELSLEILPGKIYGLLGPNGAGKTTTIRMIMGIILPDQGEVRIFDQPNSIAVLEQVGYLPEERGLYRKMKVDEVMQFFGELKGMKKKELSEKVLYWLNRMELTEWRKKKIEDLSRGMQQKLQFIITILNKPRLLILDEPFTGLDPINTNLLKDIILELKDQGTTVIFSTHLMEQVEKLCDAICLINKGQKVLAGNLHDVKKQYGRNRIQLQYSGDAAFLSDTSLIAHYDDYGNYVEIRLQDQVSSQQLLQRALEHAEVYRFEIVEPSLNEIFIETVKNQ